MTSKPSEPGIWTSRNTRSGLSARDGLRGGGAVARLAGDLEAGVFTEQVADPLAGERFVVDDEDAGRWRRRCAVWV